MFIIYLWQSCYCFLCSCFCTHVIVLLFLISSSWTGVRRWLWHIFRQSNTKGPYSPLPGLVRPRTDTAIWEFCHKRITFLLFFFFSSVCFTMWQLCTNALWSNTACYLHLPQFKLLANLYHTSRRRRWAEEWALATGKGYICIPGSELEKYPRLGFLCHSGRGMLQTHLQMLLPSEFVKEEGFFFLFDFCFVLAQSCYLWEIFWTGLIKACWPHAESQNFTELVQPWKHFARCLKTKSSEPNTRSFPFLCLSVKEMCQYSALTPNTPWQAHPMG